VLTLQRDLAAYGYCVGETGIYDEATETVVRAFQLHFRPVHVDGRADASTLAALAGLSAASAIA
jgi:N-acetylmuramoyl-L-alanine amidase